MQVWAGSEWLNRVCMVAADVALLIFFCWLLTPALAIQVFPTGLSPTLGALSGVGMPRAVLERRI
jgi:hypothetical protein